MRPVAICCAFIIADGGIGAETVMRASTRSRWGEGDSTSPLAINASVYGLSTARFPVSCLDVHKTISWSIPYYYLVCRFSRTVQFLTFHPISCTNSRTGRRGSMKMKLTPIQSS